MLQSSVHPVDSWVHTTQFSIRGQFHLRERAGTATVLNADDRPYLPMTALEVFRPTFEDPPPEEHRLYGVPFAAITKAHVVWAVGGAPDLTQEGHGRLPRAIYLLYPTFVLSGSFKVRPELRLSDFIGQSTATKPFVTVHDVCVLEPGSPGAALSELQVLRRHDFVTVNLRLAGGVLDEREREQAPA